MTGKLVVLVTCANLREANRIAQTLVGERLAACVNVQKSPVASVYRWQGKVERAREILLLAKTSARLFPRLERRVRQLHSYQTPEIMALPIAAGSRAYLNWIGESLAPQGRDRRGK
ncbi:MAG TPA: divalent-cation tolerance protein CutA [Candidatus Dormibacteraeota bacterium]|nr:divalent-cation tolerance protein CutA [Candidatus Dormibacteraeota bacterium]